MLSKKGENVKFYKTINKAFIDSVENYSDLEALYESTIFLTGLIKDIEKNIIPKNTSKIWKVFQQKNYLSQIRKF